MRLLSRVYADGSTPSKVSVLRWCWSIGTKIDDTTVVAEFHKAQVHGQIIIAV